MKLSEFLVQVFGREGTQQEFQQLETWKSEGELNAKALQEMTALNNLSEELDGYVDFDVEAALSKTLDKLAVDTPETSRSSRFLWLIPVVIVVAAIATYFAIPKSNGTEVFYAENGILESSLSDGSQYTLSSGSNLIVDKSENALSLTGKAFFDVVKQQKPMVIETSSGQIKVIGTSFNVISESDYTEVLMHSGVIEFTTQENRKYTISANEILSINDGVITTRIVEDKQVFDYWRHEELHYNNTPITNVLSDLERLFDKDYTSQKERSKGLTVTAKFDHNSEEQILSELSVITGLNL